MAGFAKKVNARLQAPGNAGFSRVPAFIALQPCVRFFCTKTAVYQSLFKFSCYKF